MKKNVVMPVVILVVICVITTGLLALTDELTADRILLNQTKKTALLIQELLPLTETINQQDATDMLRYECIAADGSKVGQVIVLAAKGYGGNISVMVGFMPDKSVAGIRILSSNETPGLGQRAGEVAFYGQYANKTVESFSVTKTTPKSDNEIAAISGATITSKAVTEVVNKALAVINGETVS